MKDHEQRRLSAIMQNATDVILTFREDGRIAFCNPAIESVFGYVADDIVGQSLALLIPADIEEQLDSFSQLNMPSTLKNAIFIRNETIAQHKNGSSIPVDFAVSRVDLDTESLFLGIICVNTTTKKETTSFQRAKEKTRAVNQAQANALETISNSFHTPLNRIVDTAVLLQHTPLTAEQNNSVRLIHDSGHALLALLSNVLESSNTEMLVGETAVVPRKKDECWPIDMAFVNRMFGTEFSGLLDELVELFLEDSPPIFVEIEQALVVFDRSIIRRGAHTLKGSSGSIGITTLAASAAELEQLSATGSKDEIETAVELLHAEYQVIADVLRIGD